MALGIAPSYDCETDERLSNPIAILGKRLRREQERLDELGVEGSYLARGEDMRKMNLTGLRLMTVIDTDCPRSHIVRHVVWGDLDAPPPDSYPSASRPAVLEDFGL